MATGKSTAVGAFVLGGLAIGAAAILLFGGARLFAGNLRVVVYFQDSVAGLATGAPVTLRGVKIGTVRSMKVFLKLPELVPVIPVYLEIESGQVSWSKRSPGDLDLAIKAGLRAQLATQSLVTGQLAVNLDFHPDTPARMAGVAGDVPEIPAIASDFQKIKDEIAELKLPELAEKARVAMAGIERITGELSASIKPVADAARTALDTTAAAVAHLQRDASRTLAAVEQQATAIGRVLAQAEKVTGALNDMTGPRAPMRGDLEAAVRDLAASAGSLRHFTRELERDPGGTLLGRPAK